MQKYIFKESVIPRNHNILFLCGVKYNIQDKEKDKRWVLGEYLKNLNPENHVIILEENFVFGRTSKKKLSYDDIFMKNLNSVETLTALFSDCVFIIHECIATGAELGLFAANELLNGRICLLVPDEYSIEENKISNFLRLAFFRGRNDIKKIVFYPSSEVWRLSNNKSDFRTTFVKNIIGQNLSSGIINFIRDKTNQNPCIIIRKALFNKHISNNDTISYYYKDNNLLVKIPTEVIKSQVIALFNIDEFKSELRKDKTISQHVSFIYNCYKNILKDTIEEKEGTIFNDIIIEIMGTKVKARESIGYLLYLLQAMKKIELIQDTDDSYIRKIRISTEFSNMYKLYNAFVIPQGLSKFGRLSK